MPTEPEPGADGRKSLGDDGRKAPTGRRAAKKPRQPAASQAPAPSQEEVWTDVVTAGVALLDKLTQALAGGGASGQAGRGGGVSLPGAAVTRDEQTGQSYLKLPLPEPETVQKIADVFAALTQGR